MHTIEYASRVVDDLAGVRPYDRIRVTDRIDTALADTPAQETRHRKPLVGLRPPWDQELPVWELRVGDYRVFYDVEEKLKVVTVLVISIQATAQDHGGHPVKTLGMEQATFDSCVREAQDDRVLLTRDGRPVAVAVGLGGLDDEQIATGLSENFWKLITNRRRDPTIPRAELEKHLIEADQNG